MQKKRKQKTPAQVEKEMNAEIEKIHRAVSKLNQLKRSLTRFEDWRSHNVVVRYDREAERIHKSWSAYSHAANPDLKQRRRGRRGDPPFLPLTSFLMGAAGALIGHAYANIKPIEPDPEWPAELDTKPEAKE